MPKKKAQKTADNRLISFKELRLTMLFLGISILYLTPKLFAQNCSIKGTVLAQKANAPIQYANILLKNLKDSTITYGEVTNEQGVFEISKVKQGKYKVVASFIGYQTVIMEGVMLQPGLRDMGKITLLEMTENLEAFSIRASRAAITYEADRKVINAGSFPGANSGMDLMENIPSVNVDIEGKLTYRGGGEFIVLINGKRVKNGEEKLRTLTADKIEKIEIITNPPAKYKAEGTAGIIQVILKKNRLEGLSINAYARGSSRLDMETHFSLEKKSKKYGWYFEGGVGDRIWNIGDVVEYQKVVSGNQEIFENEIKRKIDWNNSWNYFEVGFNWLITPKNNFDVFFSINPFPGLGGYKGKGTVVEIIGGETPSSIEAYGFENFYEYRNQYWAGEIKNDLVLNKDKTHLLTFTSVFDMAVNPYNEIRTDTKTYPTHTEKVGFIEKEVGELYITGKLDYTLPISESSTFESGVEVEAYHIPKITSTSGTFDEEGDLTPFPNNPLNQEVDYIQDVWAGYLSFKSKLAKFDYQVGARVEHTIRRSDYRYDKKNGEKVYIPASDAFTQFFPSLHLTYTKSEEHQFTASYSKRIKRAEYWDLVPLAQYERPNAYYRGNGTILPTIAHSFDMGMKKSWDDDFISLEFFGRKSMKVKEEYSYADTNSFVVETFENVGNSTSVGGEFMTGINLFPWWNTNISVSTYFYQLNVDFKELNYKNSSIYTDLKLNNNFKLPYNFALKHTVAYTSPTFSAQDEISGYLISNFSVSKDILDGVWNFTVGAQNILNTNERKITRTGEGFVYKAHSKYEPFAFLKISYSLNKQE